MLVSPDADRSARARRRRLALLALGALDRPLTGAVLTAALGEPMEAALEEAAELGFCERRGDGYMPAPRTTLELGIVLLGASEAAEILGRLLPLAHSDDRAFLIALASDPAGEGIRGAAALRDHPLAEAIRALLSEDAVEEPAPLSTSSLGGADLRTVYAAVALAANVLLKRRPDASLALVRWALGAAAFEGDITPEQGLLAVVVTQAFYDLGDREQAIRFSRAAQQRLTDHPSMLTRLLLMLLEGHLLADLHRLKESRQLFTRVEVIARAEGLNELVGVARIGLGTVIFREGHTAASAELFGSALELVAGSAGYERLALHCLSHVWAKQGRHLEAQAALAQTTPGLEIVAVRLSAYANAIGYDAFLGDLEAGRTKLRALEQELPDTAHRALAVAMSRAWLLGAAGDWAGAHATLRATVTERAARPAFSVAIACLEAACLLQLGRADDAAAALAEAARLHHLHALSRHRSLVHVLDAEISLARGDLERARRAVRRAEEWEDSLRSFDFELRIRLLSLELARRDGGRGEESAARAQVEAAWAQLTSSFTPEQLARFRSAFDRPVLLARMEARRNEEGPRVAGLLGRSPALQRLAEQLERVGPAGVDVLILGETGAGKELCARALHHLSSRRDGPFVALNCAALTDELLLTELFGHEKGAFTGAAERHLGRFERAHGGTLFLDEIAEVSPRGQASLLRALQERTFERVGGSGPIHADVRIVAATNRDLERLVAAKEFREDLYYRLRGIQLRVPPLRERREDVLVLARAFLDESAREREGERRRLTPEAEAMLDAHPWPGNVRELRSVIFAADLVSDGPEITPSILRTLMEGGMRLAGADDRDWYARLRREGQTLRAFLDGVEREIILRCVEANEGNLAAAAAELGLTRPRLSQIIHGDPVLRAWRRAGQA